MINIDYETDDSNTVVMGGNMIAPRVFNAELEQEDFIAWSDDWSSTMRLKVVWSDERFCFEIAEMALRASPGGEPLSGTTLRAIPVRRVLRTCINRVTYVGGTLGDGARLHDISVIDPDWLTVLAAQGPTPETLDWVARMYLLASIKLDPPTKWVATSFGIPNRTASHWVKLARDRGHLEK